MVSTVKAQWNLVAFGQKIFGLVTEVPAIAIITPLEKVTKKNLPIVRFMKAQNLRKSY